MNILYFDLNDKSLIEPYFDYDNYGGGAIFLRAAFQKLPNIYLAAREECFNRCPNHLLDKKIVLSEENIQDIKNGKPIVDIIDKDILNNINLVVHHFSQIWINTTGIKCKSCSWNVGYGDHVHPKNKYLLLFDLNNQSPIYYSNDHVIHEVIIGPKIPLFQEYKKEDYIFCCGRLTNSYQSIQIAQLANKYKIPVIFAGPIDSNYPFLDYLSDYTNYLGVVDYKTKINHYEKSKITIQAMNYPISVTLSCKEAMARGCGVMATPVGQYRTFVKDLKYSYEGNGWLIKSEEDFINSWQNRDLLSQKNCYDSIQQFSEDNMITSFINAFNKILNK